MAVSLHWQGQKCRYSNFTFFLQSRFYLFEHLMSYIWNQTPKIQFKIRKAKRGCCTLWIETKGYLYKRAEEHRCKQSKAGLTRHKWWNQEATKGGKTEKGSKVQKMRGDETIKTTQRKTTPSRDPSCKKKKKMGPIYKLKSGTKWDWHAGKVTAEPDTFEYILNYILLRFHANGHPLLCKYASLEKAPSPQRLCAYFQTSIYLPLLIRSQEAKATFSLYHHSLPLSMWRSSGSTPSSFWVLQLFALSQRVT